MNQIKIIIEQIALLIIPIILGLIAKKTHILNDQATNNLSKLVVNITLPIMTFFALTQYNFPVFIWKDGIIIILFGIAIHMISFLFGQILSNRLKLDPKKANVFITQLMIGNTAFFAFPIMRSLFGEIGLLYAIIYYLVSIIFIWTLGVYLFNRHHLSNKKDIIKPLLNPCTIAIILGFIMKAINFDYLVNGSIVLANSYNLLYKALSPVGEMTFSLSMIFIGLILGDFSLKRFLAIFTQWPIIILVSIKLFIIPILFITLFYFYTFSLTTIASTVIVIETLMPASTITVAIAKEYDADYKYAMEIAVVTTVISIITIPLLLGLFQLIM